MYLHNHTNRRSDVSIERLLSTEGLQCGKTKEEELLLDLEIVVILSRLHDDILRILIQYSSERRKRTEFCERDPLWVAVNSSG